MMDRQQLKSLVMDIVAEIQAELTLTTSSVELATNAKGQTTIKVKVYDRDAIAAANRANYLQAKEQAIINGEPFKQPERIPYPEGTGPIPQGRPALTQEPTSQTSTDGPSSPAEVKRQAAEQPGAPVDDDEDLFKE